MNVKEGGQPQLVLLSVAVAQLIEYVVALSSFCHVRLYMVLLLEICNIPMQLWRLQEAADSNRRGKEI